MGKSYKKRHTKKHRNKNKKTRHHRKKQKGGKGDTCYGSGVGANNFDPNWSIFNTRLLELFPYKP